MCVHVCVKKIIKGDNYPKLKRLLIQLKDQTSITLLQFTDTRRILRYPRARENFSLTQNWRVLYFGFAEVEENQPEYIADHQAGNDAWSLPRGTCRANYGGNRFLRFSGISKKQFSDFSWRSAVEENWRTSGQSTVFHAGSRDSKKFFRIFRRLFILTRLNVSAVTNDSTSIVFVFWKWKYYYCQFSGETSDSTFKM